MIARRHAAFAAASGNPCRAVDRPKQFDDGMLIIGHLLDRQLGPIRWIGPRRTKVAILDGDLVGAQQLRRLGWIFMIVIVVPGGEQNHRRGDIAMDQRHFLRKRLTIRLVVIHRLRHLQHEIPIGRRKHGRRCFRNGNAGQRCEPNRNVARVRIGGPRGIGNVIGRRAAIAACSKRDHQRDNDRTIHAGIITHFRRLLRNRRTTNAAQRVTRFEVLLHLIAR